MKKVKYCCFDELDVDKKAARKVCGTVENSNFNKIHFGRTRISFIIRSNNIINNSAAPDNKNGDPDVIIFVSSEEGLIVIESMNKLTELKHQNVASNDVSFMVPVLIARCQCRYTLEEVYNCSRVLVKLCIRWWLTPL